jgi:ATP-binding cassette subfamily B protein
MSLSPSILHRTASHRTIPERYSIGSLLRRSAQFVAPYKFRVLAIVMIALVLALLGAADPLVMKYFFDSMTHGGARALPIALGALVAIEVGRALLGAWLRGRTWNVRLDVDFAMRARLIAKLHDLPMEYHDAEGVGATMNKVNLSVTAFINAFGELGFNVLPTLVYLALSIVAMLRLDWRLAIVVLVFTPLPALIGAWASREQTDRERRLMDHWTRIYSRLNEVLSGIRTVKLYAMEDEERRRFLMAQAEGNAVVAKGVRTDAKTEAARNFAASLARLAAIGFGGWLILRGDITIGSLVAFLGYISGLFGPVQGLTNIYQTIQKATVALETIFGILDADDVVNDLDDAYEAPPLHGDIRFEHIGFEHADGVTLFDDLQLEVHPGETVALVGESGSGKTTLVSLLLRLHPLRAGRITVDGHDIGELTAHSLRRQVAVVQQDVHLFNDTVRANIAYARPSATMEEVEAAARAAFAHDFIMSLPDGYDTMVGERGNRLSGGQRQRIAIARALLKDAPILILDEATSALDTVSEASVQHALDSMRVGRTTIVIAHRLSTVIDADRIVLLQNGRIVAEGTHRELLGTSPYYTSLVGAAAGDVLANVA